MMRRALAPAVCHHRHRVVVLGTVSDRAVRRMKCLDCGSILGQPIGAAVISKRRLESPRTLRHAPASTSPSPTLFDAAPRQPGAAPNGSDNERTGDRG